MLKHLVCFLFHWQCDQCHTAKIPVTNENAPALLHLPHPAYRPFAIIDGHTNTHSTDSITLTADEVRNLSSLKTTQALITGIGGLTRPVNM